MNRNFQKEEEFYANNKFCFSYSSLNKLLFSPFLFYKDYILKDKEVRTDKHLVEGKLLHCLLFEPDNLKDKLYLIILLVISILLSFLIVKNFDAKFLLNTILISSSLYLFFITLRDFFIKKHNNISQNIAHFGFSLLILSILFNNLFSTEIITNLKVGDPTRSSILSALANP